MAASACPGGEVPRRRVMAWLRRSRSRVLSRRATGRILRARLEGCLNVPGQIGDLQQGRLKTRRVGRRCKRQVVQEHDTFGMPRRSVTCDPRRRASLSDGAFENPSQ